MATGRCALGLAQDPNLGTIERRKLSFRQQDIPDGIKNKGILLTILIKNAGLLRAVGRSIGISSTRKGLERRQGLFGPCFARSFVGGGGEGKETPVAGALMREQLPVGQQAFDADK